MLVNLTKHAFQRTLALVSPSLCITIWINRLPDMKWDIIFDMATQKTNMETANSFHLLPYTSTKTAGQIPSYIAKKKVSSLQ